MSGTALLVIDVQMAMFLSGEGVYQGTETLKTIVGVLDKARQRELPIIFIQHSDEMDEEYAPGTELWKLHPDLAPQSTERIIRKTRWDSFYGTTLHQTLQEMGISRLIVCGMQTEFCMDTTLRSAFFHGYECFLPKRSHTTFHTPVLPAEKIIEHHERIWNGRFAKIVRPEDIERVMEEAAPRKEAEGKVLEALDLRFCQETGLGKEKSWAAYFGPAGKMLTKAGENIQGPEAIEAAMKDFFQLDALDFKWAAEYSSMSVAKDMGYTYGKYRRTYLDAEKKEVLQEGRYLTVWRLQADGTYKVEVDIGN